jgi:hypothetical protein
MARLGVRLVVVAFFIFLFRYPPRRLLGYSREPRRRSRINRGTRL